MNLYVWVLTIFAAFGGFMFGYDIGVINGVKEMEGFQQTFNLSTGTSGNTSQQCSGAEDIGASTLVGLIVSIFSLGCLLGALLAGVSWLALIPGRKGRIVFQSPRFGVIEDSVYQAAFPLWPGTEALSEKAGRKPAIMIGSLIFIVGGALQSAAFFIWMIIVGRITAGVGVGILSMVVPVYNAELAPKSLRGSLVSLHQLAITAGIMVSFITAVWTRYFLEGWRVALGFEGALGLILIVGMVFLPETPRWLVKNHKDEKAARILNKLRRAVDPEDVQNELNEIQLSVKESEAGGGGPFLVWRAVLRWKMIQRILIGVFLQLFQQFTGIDVIMYYSTFIFGHIGVEQYASTAIVGTTNFLTTILAVFLVDKVGRKSLLLLGGVGMLLSMCGAATFILAFRIGDSECSSGGVGAVGYIVVFFVCFFVFNFAYSWGPIAWVVTSEIFPLQTRGVAVSITTAANSSGNFIIAMLTPILIASPLKIFGTFYIVCGALFLAVLFVLFTLPETKGESLERIDALFSRPWLERTNVLYYLKCCCPWRCKNKASYWPNNPQENNVVTEQDKMENRALLFKSKDSENIPLKPTRNSNP